MSLCIFKVPHHEEVRSGCIALCSLKLNHRCEWSASHPGERAPRYSLDRRLGRPLSQYGHGGKEKNPSPCH